ncbi:Acetyl esterase/lipase [Desulfatibacillum alkenivorans DSM 16219]|uniref:Acetyl esterase/lipase n=1 Tax=Desulfatibacillum alkenivorans DSM 16219 TaxID=1121393 RepID=A0A1M6EJ59_9BACT|nr:alpha/beta hydrolase [Desulfatibacillum alkenivorans]SHI85449.1 Acetyl esterase/lipase [Desulfatibacillum alkenivorans DSM 16219]
MAARSNGRKKPNVLLRSMFNDSPQSLWFQRFMLDGIVKTLGRTPQKAKIIKTRIESMPAEIITGWAHTDGRTLLYLHGGAYLMGSISTHRPLASALCRITSARGVIIDYRLAPEHPFPAALEDALLAYGAILASGVKPEKIVIAGDSAGGGLTLALLLALKQKSLPLPAGAYCMSPWTNLYECNKSGQFQRTGVKHRQDRYVRYASDLYAAGSDKKNPLISPAYGDYAGLPPILVQAAKGELLRCDARETVERAQAHGVDAALEIYNSRVHVLQGLAGRSGLGRSLLIRGGRFLADRLD